MAIFSPRLSLHGANPIGILPLTCNATVLSHRTHSEHQVAGWHPLRYRRAGHAWSEAALKPEEQAYSTSPGLLARPPATPPGSSRSPPGAVAHAAPHGPPDHARPRPDRPGPYQNGQLWPPTPSPEHHGAPVGALVQIPSVFQGVPHRNVRHPLDLLKVAKLLPQLLFQRRGQY